MLFTTLCNQALLRSLNKPERRSWGINQTLGIMQLTALLLLVFSLTLSAKTVSQTVSFTGKNVSLEKVLVAVESQTGYFFITNREEIRQAKKVTIDVKNVELQEFLKLVLKDQPFEFTIQGKTIAIRKKADTSNASRANTQQYDGSGLQSTLNPVTGAIKDSSGAPLAGASIKIKGTKSGVTTDASGSFSIDCEPGNVLLISYVGFETKEIKVFSTNVGVITLSPSRQKLDEVVFKGYYSTTKQLNTGNVSTIKAQDIEKQPISNVLQALQGLVPGMFITQETGVPGGGFKVQIRGQNSIANGNDPLYVIDGVPYYSKLLPNTVQSIITENPLNYINPSDIESVDILKDADATAIYGSRGANGVVLITTKKGKVSKTKLDINTYIGYGNVGRFMNLLNTQQYLEMRNEAFKNNGELPQSWNAPDLLFWDTTRYTDWQKVSIGGTSQYTDVQVSLSGGNSNTQYIIGGGYHKETTVFPGEFADQKGTVHFNISSVSENKRFSASLSGNYLIDRNNLPAVDFTGEIFQSPNTPEPFHPDGSLNWENNTWMNPMAYLLNKVRSRTNNLISNAALSYKILPNLELKTNLGFNHISSKGFRAFPISSYNPTLNVTVGSASFSDNFISSWIIEPQIQYRRRIANGSLNFLFGITLHNNKSEGQYVVASGIADDALLENMAAASSIEIASLTNTVYKYNSIYARLGYDWKNKYVLNITARRDGSSRFGPGRQFANFGAVGVAWIFSKEKVIVDQMPVLSYGKLRFTYGTTGNDQIADYSFLDLYNTTTYSYSGSMGLYPRSLFNNNLAWEEIRKMEFGADLGFWQNRILVSAAYYRNYSSNQLVQIPLSSITGFGSITANLPAKVENTGFEITLSTTNIKSRSFTWSSSANLTISRNKLKSFPGIEKTSYRFRYTEGRSLTSVKQYRSLGVNPDTGIYEFEDAKGNTTYDPTLEDITAFIETMPKFYGGLQNSLQFRGFQLDFLLQFVKQIGMDYSMGLYPGYQANQPSTVLGRWRNPGDLSKVQKFDANYYWYAGFDYATTSTLAYDDASFIRLKNISLSYQLPATLRQRIHFEDVRIYLKGQNIWTITDYQGLDPETQSRTTLPPLRVMTVGIQLSL